MGRSRWRLGGALAAGLLALQLASAPAEAAPKQITGKLSKRGLTVIALAADGEASSRRVGGGGFRLRPPAKRVTLHLRASDGAYAGPIVAARRKGGRRAIVGVKHGARLGRVKVNLAQGVAKVRRKLPEKWLDEERVARARNGVPKGADVFGRVLSKLPRRPAPGDRDLDGIPGPLDVDDDGDLVLDSLGSATRRSALRVRGSTPEQPGNDFVIGSALSLPTEDTANANAPGSTDAQIESQLPAWGLLGIQLLPGDSSELDCGGAPDPADPDGWSGGLVYCTKGGTGAVGQPGGGPLSPFPECCDGDDDGFGTLPPSPSAPSTANCCAHGANSSQIKTGDLLIQRVTTGGIETQFAATLPFVFATVPALVSYSDTAGNSGTVSYPILGPGDPGGPGPGANGNGLPVAAGPDGNVVLTLTYWRPQRRPIEGETCPPAGAACEPNDWIDIGGLAYDAGVSDIAGMGGLGGLNCPQSAFSTSDPNLAPTPPSFATTGGGLTDLSADRPADSANTFTLTLNVTECLHGRSWEVGQELGLGLTANSDLFTSRASQGINFKREG